MSDSTTSTMSLTITNPEAFDTVQELRQKLHRANDNIVNLSDQLHCMNYLVNCLSNRIIRLVQAHLADDQATIETELTELTAHCLREKKSKHGGLH